MNTLNTIYKTGSLKCPPDLHYYFSQFLLHHWIDPEVFFW